MQQQAVYLRLHLSDRVTFSFGTAHYITPGNLSNRAVQLEADDSSEFGGVSFGIPAGTTVADLDSLSTDYRFPAGSTCGGGSPRFQIAVDNDNDSSTAAKNIFVYIGPPPSYTGCPAGAWSNTTNLIDPTDLVDATQLGGLFYQPWASVEVAYGTLPVVGVSVVTDTFAGPRTVDVDNTDVDGTVYDYEFDNKEDCKKGGWQNFTFAPGPFKNQGECVS